MSKPYWRANHLATHGNGDQGKSGTGKISWEIRLDNNNYTLWLWPEGHKDQATQVGSAEDAMPVAATLNGDDT